MTDKERAKRYFEIGTQYSKKSELMFECKLLIYEMIKHLSNRAKPWVTANNFEAVVINGKACVYLTLGNTRYLIPITEARTLSDWHTNDMSLFRTFRQSYYDFCINLTDKKRSYYDDDYTFKHIMQIIDMYGQDKELRKQYELRQKAE